MTNEDAIKRLEKLKAIYSGMDIKSDIDALDMAIKALREEKTAEVRPMQVELTEELKEEIKQTLIQSNKDLSYALEDYDRGWLGGNLEIVRILEKHYGEFIDDDEIMRESEEEE